MFIQLTVFDVDKQFLLNLDRTLFVEPAETPDGKIDGSIIHFEKEPGELRIKESYDQIKELIKSVGMCEW